MPLDRVKANELLELVVIDQSPKARALLLDKLEECVTPDPRLITCARCGREMLALEPGNAPDNDVMEVCSPCTEEIWEGHARDLAGS